MKSRRKSNEVLGRDGETTTNGEIDSSKITWQDKIMR